MAKPALGLRKSEILEAALDLFHRKGFHRVGIDEIGAAVGVTGPAIYSHFPGKTALLVAIFDRTAEELFDFGPPPPNPRVPRTPFAASWPTTSTTSLNSRPLISIWVRDTGSLPAADQERVREIQRRYLRLWVDELRALHTDMGPAEAHSIVQGAFNFMGSVAFYEPKLGREALRRLLERKATALLLEP